LIKQYIGIDIIEIDRIQKTIERWGDIFLKRVYTDSELDLFRKNIPSLAARFAAKEAVMKLLGTGVRGVSWRDIETIYLPSGKPFVKLHGRAKQVAAELGITEIDISLSHSREYAVASAAGIAETNP